MDPDSDPDPQHCQNTYGSGSVSLVSSQCTLFLFKVMLPMGGQSFDDPSSKWFSLQDRVSIYSMKHSGFNIKYRTFKIRRPELEDKSAIHRVPFFVLFPAVIKQFTEWFGFLPPPFSLEDPENRKSKKFFTCSTVNLQRAYVDKDAHKFKRLGFTHEFLVAKTLRIFLSDFFTKKI